MFEQSMVIAAGGGRKTASLAASITMQVGMLGAGLVLPLILTDQLPSAQLSALFVLPSLPPVAAAPAEPEATQMVRRTRPVVTNEFIAPSFIPKDVAPIVDEIPYSDSLMSIASLGNSTQHAVRGGVMGLDPLQNLAMASAAAPPPPQPVVQEPKAPERIKLGGEVVAARAVHRPQPAYPALAKQARIQGTVVLQAIIGTDGRIQQLHVESGHPLLVQAAVLAVSEWRYTPTFLNGDPVEVITQIHVNFALR